MIPIPLYAIVRVRERRNTSIPMFYVPPRGGHSERWLAKLFFRSLYRSRKEVLEEFRKLKPLMPDGTRMSIWTFRLSKVAVTDDPATDWA